MASGNADSGGKLEINVQLTRCVCIHALHQAVDTIIQALLYQRNIVPRLVSDLIDVTAEQLLNLKISEADEDYCLNSPLPVSLNAAQKFSQEFLMVGFVLFSVKSTKVVPVWVLRYPGRYLRTQ